MSEIENNGIKPSEKNRNESFERFFDYIELLAVYFSIGLVIILLFFRHCPVDGVSMQNTLSQNDLLIVSDVFYTPKTGDIIVCQSAEYGLDRPLVKRVIATSGQSVKIDYHNWEVSVDGKILDEDYVKRHLGTKMNSSDYLENEFVVPDGLVFVMGDNRNQSLDSRSSNVGLIDERFIIGEVKLRIFPISKFRVF